MSNATEKTTAMQVLVRELEDQLSRDPRSRALTLMRELYIDMPRQADNLGDTIEHRTRQLAELDSTIATRRETIESLSSEIKAKEQRLREVTQLAAGPKQKHVFSHVQAMTAMDFLRENPKNHIDGRRNSDHRPGFKTTTPNGDHGWIDAETFNRDYEDPITDGR